MVQHAIMDLSNISPMQYFGNEIYCYEVEIHYFEKEMQQCVEHEPL